MITTEINGRVFEIDSQGFLSPTEELALEDWLHDMRVQDAAQKRFRSPETISTHRKNLRGKTNQQSAAGVLAYCLSHGFIRLAGQCDHAHFFLGLRLSATLELLPLTSIDHQFHRAQARIRIGVGASWGQKVVAPLFRQPAVGEADFYEIPTYLRNRITERDHDNQVRLTEYAERVRAHVQQGAAA